MDENIPESPGEILQLFVGREKEMDSLRRTLLEDKPATVCISGPRGIGKTTLAWAFAYQSREFFPGGVHNLQAAPFEPLDRTVDREVLGGGRVLIVIDDLDVRPQRQINDEIAGIRREHPTAGIIVASHFPIHADLLDLDLRLDGLSQDEFRELLKMRLAVAGTADFTRELYASFLGSPFAAYLVAHVLKSGKVKQEEILPRLRDFHSAGILDAAGREIVKESPEDRHIVADVVSVSDAFLRTFHDNPELLYELTARGFEEIVAELLSRLKYQVTLTPASKDGGKDIYAAKKDHLGTFLYIVECKRYAPNRPVGVGLIRQLNGVVQAEQATAGILATTSFFTREAKEFQRTIAYQVSLKDYFDIRGWLEAVTKK
jgi:restriction system protein